MMTYGPHQPGGFPHRGGLGFKYVITTLDKLGYEEGCAGFVVSTTAAVVGWAMVVQCATSNGTPTRVLCPGFFCQHSGCPLI